MLEASGGKVELTKWIYYVLNYKLNNDKDPIAMTTQQQVKRGYKTIYIQENNNQTETKIQQPNRN